MNRTIENIRRSETYINYIEALRSNIEEKRRIAYANESEASIEERFNVSDLCRLKIRI